ncbi:3,4-dihydroxy-2-butanone 4-phosphate synthase [Candidatus Kinetoplastibacterium sorsogonicusi]|uniref:3,4-dihydroxy-2-butanone 4-phosphate synthase n=1 Tax=Candidatus Kinetoplastidibacterium kentomonadis TaxID=1576550 RepID=A0A3Q8ERG4_9PROT|nr:3,4-dihydroxy-2-butanone-4-phosphate synthase [Candidatus Kinetoplastibacterium sorsogonicusi]AWD32381.1 3,4-dihydroxy-2-butanone 4-phosphate synthase [Candidatus Kinetoplastibacterium sorsogonicusi]
MSYINNNITPIHEIIEEIRKGKMIILMDDEKRENEGDLLISSEFVSPDIINFMITYGRGLVCLTLNEEFCKKLNLTPMVEINSARYGTNFTQSIEAAHGVTTGISAYDRSVTIKTAINKTARPTDLVKPGHIFPIKALNGGVLERSGHTEAGCDLTSIAGLTPSAVICEILHPNGTMAKFPYISEFSTQHNIKIATIKDLIKYRLKTESIFKKINKNFINTKIGTFVFYYDSINIAINTIFLQNINFNNRDNIYLNIYSDCINKTLEYEKNNFFKAIKNIDNFNKITIFMNSSVNFIKYIFNEYRIYNYEYIFDFLDFNKINLYKNIYDIKFNSLFLNSITSLILNDLNISNVKLDKSINEFYSLENY